MVKYLYQENSGAINEIGNIHRHRVQHTQEGNQAGRIFRNYGRSVSDKAIDWERYIENRKSSVRCKFEKDSVGGK